MSSNAQDRKRARSDDRPDVDRHHFTGAEPVHATTPVYAPDESARGADALNRSGENLLWAFGGMDIQDSQPLPSPASIPSFTYPRYQTRSRTAAARVPPAESADVSEHEAVLERFLRDEFKRRPSQETGQRAVALTSGMVDTAVFRDDERAVRGDGTAGQGWTRTAETDYLLEGETKGGLRPSGRTGNFRDEGAEQPPIPEYAPPLINELVAHMKRSWPRLAVNPGRAENARHALVNGYIFFHEYLDEYLTLRGSQVQSKTPESPPESPAYRLLHELTHCDPEHSLKRVVLQSVLGKLKNYAEDTDGLGYALQESRKFIEANNAMRAIGEKARANAVWIRLERIPEEELRSFDDKVIAETNTIARVGILTGAFGANDVRVVDNTWNRIERPSADDPHLRSFILWEPEGPEDFEPTMDKVVSGIIYNSPALANLTTEFQLNHDCDRHAKAIETLLSHNSVGRNVLDNNGTVKMPEGTHTINGQVQTQPFAAAIPKPISEHSSFRHEYTERRDVSQVWAFEAIATFLPRFAREQMMRCRESGLLTRFGTPAYACFGSWGYFSSSHIDADDGATHADVTERGIQVKPDSSNFFLTKYKLIMELADKARWFWEANKTEHGTTLCYPSAAYPRKWKLFVRHKHLRATGQITSAFVTTKKGNSAAARRI